MTITFLNISSFFFFTLGFSFHREVQENEYKAVHSVNDYNENEQYKNPLK